MNDETESDKSIAMRLVLRLGSAHDKLNFNVGVLFEIAALFVEKIPREKMLAVIEKLDALEAK